MSEIQTTDAHSKTQILKSTAIFGSAQVIIIIVGMVRTKVLALLLGPLGIGIAGLYQSTLDLIKTITGLGLGYSGVRDIVDASASGDIKKLSTVFSVIKRWTLIASVAGVLLTIAFSRQISQLTFGDNTHATGISILSVTLLFSAFSTPRSALLQGLRQISKMAKATVWSAIASLFGAIAIYYFFGIKGIIPAIVWIAFVELVIILFYSRSIKTEQASLSTSKSFVMGQAMIKLGFFMTMSALASTVSMYFVRSFIARQNGLDVIGYFVAAWTISSLYISAAFNEMGADYFPRLTSVHNDRKEANKLVNDQTEIALLLTVPVIVIMISFIDWIVPVFYSKAFTVTGTILSWQLLGDFFKVLAWPLGFILLAKGKGLIFLITEVTWNILFCSIVYFGWSHFGVEITGIGFLITYFV